MEPNPHPNLFYLRHDLFVQELFTLLLMPFYRIHTFSHTRKMLETFRQNIPPDILLIDAMVADYSLSEVIAECLQLHSSCKIVIVGEGLSPSLRQKYLSFGATCVLDMQHAMRSGSLELRQLLEQKSLHIPH